MRHTGGRQTLVVWLRGSDADRRRYLDMHDRFRRPWVFGVLIGGTTLLAAGTYGWWLVVLPMIATVTMGACVAMHDRSAHPELVGMVSFLLLEVNLAASVLVSGGGASPLLSLMVVPIVSQAVIFRPRLTVLWVALSAVLVIVVVAMATRLVDVPAASLSLRTVSYMALLGCLALSAHYLAAADAHSRDEASQDALTGLLNRKQLGACFDEVVTRMRSRREPLTLLMVDVDNFKKINDVHGHQGGDLVLRRLAQRLVAHVRPEDLLFRVGGEEFLVLMPGLDSTTARAAADRLNRAVSARPVAGITVTVSVGVSSKSHGDLNYGAMVQAADLALYEAKQDGRDCVRSAPPHV